MSILIALIPAIPFLSFLILALFGSRFSRKVAGYIGAGSIGIAATLTLIVGIGFLRSLPEVKSYSVNIWEWIKAGNLKVDISFTLDALSLVFCLLSLLLDSLSIYTQSDSWKKMKDLPDSLPI